MFFFQKFRSIEEIQSAFATKNITMSSEMELLSELYLELIEYTPDNDSKVLDSILDDIEYHIHKYDNAVYFADLGGIDRVVQILNQSSDMKLISKAAICLGAAAQRLVTPALLGPVNVAP